MRNDFKSNYLMHHGILGMKWGQRNGPPYPLGSEDHSASEKKAGYKKSIGGGRNEELYDRKRRKNKSIADKVSSKVHEINGKRLESAAKAGYKDADDLRKHGFKEEADAVQKIADNNKEKAAKEREKQSQDFNIELTDSQKKAIKIGLGIAGAAAITAGSIYVAKRLNTKAVEGLTKEAIARGKLFFDRYQMNYERETKALKLAFAADKMDDVKDANMFISMASQLKIKSEKALRQANQNFKIADIGKFSTKEKIDYLRREIMARGHQQSESSDYPNLTKLTPEDWRLLNSLTNEEYDKLMYEFAKGKIYKIK